MKNRLKKHMRRFFTQWALPAGFLLGAAFIAPGGQSAQAAEPVLKIGADCAYPPFVYKDSTGAWKGFDVDIGDEIARRMHMLPQRQCVTWDGLLPGLLVGKYDVIIAAMDATSERAKRVDFSIPYYRSPDAFIGPKSMANAPVKNGILTPDFLKGKTVGVLRASIFERYLQKTYPGVRILRYDSMDDVLIDLKAGGRIDLAFTDMAKAESDFLHKPGNQDYVIIGPAVTDYAALGAGAAVALRKGNTELKDKVDEAIKSMMADGTYDKISHKYWPFSVKPQ